MSEWRRACSALRRRGATYQQDPVVVRIQDPSSPTARDDGNVCTEPATCVANTCVREVFSNEGRDGGANRRRSLRPPRLDSVARRRRGTRGPAASAPPGRRPPARMVPLHPAATLATADEERPPPQLYIDLQTETKKGVKYRIFIFMKKRKKTFSPFATTGVLLLPPRPSLSGSLSRSGGAKGREAAATSPPLSPLPPLRAVQP